ncbi:phosphoglycerate kinase [candidate division WWE3 bacterium]|uniref:Phosphoglycerate kinase n=1 Tax=candidate division WWE3 bacterium TaxID=2053526 RepID=A0A955LL84_UNCKA|nr:phosphoglycerate kinase [candidate division WWE3 bacterium]
MTLRTIQQADLDGKTILYRSPYDIEVVDENGDKKLVDDSRIVATIPTLKYLLEHNCKIVILTYVGRPNGEVVEELRTGPHAKRLSELLNKPVPKLDDCVGPQVTDHIKNMQPGELVMLENTRFHEGEVEDDDEFAMELSKNGEVVVFDAFPQAHRFHASVTGIMRHLPSYAGFSFIKEVDALSGLLENPARPFTVIIGGAKISDKVAAISNLYDIADMFIVGGGVANVFLKAAGKEIGSSFIEDVYVDAQKGEKKDWVEFAKDILSRDQSTDRDLETLYELGSQYTLHRVQYPYDLIVADSINNPQQVKEVRSHDNDDVVPDGWAALDIGGDTQQLYRSIIAKSRTVFWNGPMGMFEDERFASGSKTVGVAMADSSAQTVIAGGDTIAAAKRYSDISRFSHISLAGGAALEFLAGNQLPAVEMLQA